MMGLIRFLQFNIERVASWNFLATVPIRIYLAAVFWTAGMNKLNGFSDTVAWFGNPDWGLGMPFPTLMASLATAAELGGAILLLFGLATRWATIPLMFTMIVAAITAHWHNGWQAVHDLLSPWANEHAAAALDRLDRANGLLQEHGNYGWLTEHGHFVVSNNGIEWAATYFILLLALFVIGGGRYFSIDFWIKKRFMPETVSKG